ncbi:MAG TPA: zf-HC2 domain-containing protein [Polyangiaceae bacterium]|jgi:anti-sigma factor RsiW
MSEHLSREALEGYVIGSLDEAECARVEAHVTRCAACEARLQHEASLELAFTQVAARAEEKPRRAPRYAASAVAFGGVLAFAAAMVLWLTPRAEPIDARSASEPQAIPEMNADASTATAQLDSPGDGAVRSTIRD